MFMKKGKVGTIKARTARIGRGSMVARKAVAIIKDTFTHPFSTSTITITPTGTTIEPKKSDHKPRK